MKLTNEYQAKSSYVQNDLEQSFLDMHCTKGEDVRTFLKGLQYKHNELAAAGVTVSDRDYRRTVLRGIPRRLAEFASWLLTSRSSSNPIDTDMLIGDICKEADRTKNRCGRERETSRGKQRPSSRTRKTRPSPPQIQAADEVSATQTTATTVARPGIGRETAALQRRRGAAHQNQHRHPRGKHWHTCRQLPRLRTSPWAPRTQQLPMTSKVTASSSP
jgi:hypothetical protein